MTTLATGGIHRGLAPALAATPYITMRSVPGGEDLMVVGAHRVWYRGLFDVIAVGTELQWSVLDQIAAAIDLLLHRGSGTPTNGVVHECVRELPISFDEEDEGVQYVYVGGSYRISVSATS